MKECRADWLNQQSYGGGVFQGDNYSSISIVLEVKLVCLADIQSSLSK